jgi:outer membrane lipoprotein carrier protein
MLRTMMSKALVGATAILLISINSVQAQSTETGRQIQAQQNADMQAFVDRLGKTDNLQADFVQVLRAADKRELQRTEGTMVVGHPGKLRWQTLPPFEQLVVSDGELLWVYDLDLEQVTLRSLGSSLQDTPALLLSGNREEIERHYQVRVQPSGESLDVFELTPLDESQLFSRLEFVYDDQYLAAIRIHDATGQVTDISLSNVRINQPLDRYAFVFDVPEGADVIDARDGF